MGCYASNGGRISAYQQLLDDCAESRSFDICPLYTFHEYLNSTYSNILLSLFFKKKHTTINDKIIHGHKIYSIWERMYISGVESYTPIRKEAFEKFESIIRIIPGSYQNGDWRQLDGFFGMYFNEKTMEVSEDLPAFFRK